MLTYVLDFIVVVVAVLLAIFIAKKIDDFFKKPYGKLKFSIDGKPKYCQRCGELYYITSTSDRVYDKKTGMLKKYRIRVYRKCRCGIEYLWVRREIDAVPPIDL